MTWSMSHVAREMFDRTRRQNTLAPFNLGRDTSMSDEVHEFFDGVPQALAVLAIDHRGEWRIERSNSALHALAGGPLRQQGDPEGDDAVTAFVHQAMPHLEMARRTDGDAAAATTSTTTPQRWVRSTSAVFSVTRTDGSGWWARSRLDLLSASMTGFFLLGVEDFSEYQQEVDQLRQAAFHDPLTGLANRALAMDRLRHALVADRRSRSGVTLFYLDLDGFKAVNDEHGHGSGDVVLKAVAHRLQQVVRGGDTVGRMGGDEFVIVAPALSEPSVAMVRERLVSAVSEPIVLPGGSTVTVGTSIGAVTSSSSHDALELLEMADRNMYSHKVRGSAALGR